MKQTHGEDRQWYAIHTYSGYEDAVARNLKQRIDSFGMGEQIFNVVVPIEKKIKIKGGKRVVIEERIYPGYVLVDMVVTDASWYVVRNTPNVTGFIGLGTTPTPIDPAEIDMLKKRMGVAEPKFKIDVRVGESVHIVDGPFKNFEGKIQEVDDEKGKVKVLRTFTYPPLEGKVPFHTPRAVVKVTLYPFASDQSTYEINCQEQSIQLMERIFYRDIVGKVPFITHKVKDTFIQQSNSEFAKQFIKTPLHFEDIRHYRMYEVACL